ncbi:hypothetical protein VPH166E361_0086 [Vibrio phage 166E36-1]
MSRCNRKVKKGQVRQVNSTARDSGWLYVILDTWGEDGAEILWLTGDDETLRSYFTHEELYQDIVVM